MDAHVEDEWSLAQTLRHLVLATDAWLRGGVLRLEQPFHEIGQRYALKDASEAHRALEARRTSGSTVLTV